MRTGRGVEGPASRPSRQKRTRRILGRAARRYRRGWIGYARKLGGPDDAEDLVHRVIRKTLETSREFATPQDIDRYVLRGCANAAVDLQRSRAIRRSHATLSAGEDTASRRRARRSLWADVDRFWQTARGKALGKAAVEAFELWMQGCSYSEIAATQSVSKSTAHERVQAVIGALQNYFS